MDSRQMRIARVTTASSIASVRESRGQATFFRRAFHQTDHEGDDAILIRNAENRAQIRVSLRFPFPMDRPDRRNLHFQLAQHYGRKCRLVFPHGDWKQHEARIAHGWEYMGRDLPWDQAREAVHEGWEMVDFDARALLFSAINDGDDEDEPGDARRTIQ